MKVLVVRDTFGDRAVGQMIRDPEEIAAIEAAGQAHFCTVTDVDEAFFEVDAPPAPPKAKPAPAPAEPAPAPAPEAQA